MSDQVLVEVSFDEDGKIQFDQALMNAMWQPSRLLPHPVDGVHAFEYKNEHIGLTDLLCFMDELSAELRQQGPEQIIEVMLELINSVYIGDQENFMLIGRVYDIYAVELDGRNGLVFRTVVFDSRKEIEEILMIREVAKELFPVPQPE
ncbi:MAG: hypothetical protein ACXVOI_05270 [Tumebacillaceae bacterium]